jgi:hypothetical protein
LALAVVATAAVKKKVKIVGNFSFQNMWFFCACLAQIFYLDATFISAGDVENVASSRKFQF